MLPHPRQLQHPRLLSNSASCTPVTSTSTSGRHFFTFSLFQTTPSLKIQFQYLIFRLWPLTSPTLPFLNTYHYCPPTFTIFYYLIRKKLEVIQFHENKWKIITISSISTKPCRLLHDQINMCELTCTNRDIPVLITKSESYWTHIWWLFLT